MSSKVDSLLKKATTFERLSLYGDRRTFLQALSQSVTSAENPRPWSMYDEPGDPRGNERNWVEQVQNGQTLRVYVGPQVGPEDVKHQPSLYDKYLRPHESNKLPNIIMPPSGDNQASPVDRDMSLNLQHRMDAPAVPEKAVPAKPVPNAQQWAQKLVNTLNAYSQRATSMNDQQKSSTLKQLNSTTLAELIRVRQQMGGSDNPYASPQEQAMVAAIDRAVQNFGNAFSAQITEAPNYSKLTQMMA